MSLSFRFKHSLDDFNLEVETSITEQGVTAIYGPSAAGKTSLLRLLAGLDRAERGQIVFNDSTWQSDTLWVPPWKRRLAYVFQQPSLFEHQDVSANLSFASDRASANNTRLSQDQIVEIFDLGHLLARSVTNLSGGQQQRVAMARALCSQPRLLLMDEPLSALDEAAKKQILPYLESLCAESGIPIVYVSHSLREVARLADSIILMDQGRIVSQGLTQDVLNTINTSHHLSGDIENLLNAKLVGHDPEYSLSLLETGFGQISVGTLSQELGSTVRLTLSARDISLTLEHQRATSILNIFTAQVESLEALDQAQMLVRLRAGDSTIIAIITKKSAHNLGLKSGLKVYCQAKTVSIL